MKLTMRLGPRSYDIILRRGALGRVGQLVNLSRKVLVVTDSGVPQQYLSTVLAQCPQGVPVVLEQGEGSKSLAVTERLCAAMLQHGFARTDAVLALGGGAGWYFKIYRPKQQRATEAVEEDYGDELDAFDDLEDDTPPWDEDEV